MQSTTLIFSALPHEVPLTAHSSNPREKPEENSERWCGSLNNVPYPRDVYTLKARIDEHVALHGKGTLQA